VYDPGRITYSRLLEVFWRNHDPLTVNAQFCDVGSQCSPAIFVHDEMQRRLAEESKRAVAQQLQKPVVTDIVAATQFWPAEDYHQDYYKKKLIRYAGVTAIASSPPTRPLRLGVTGRGGQRGDSTSTDRRRATRR
jgi:peptide-methionine (S)-S-oxide reductase